ncbi:MAG: butyrate kinase [Bacteroidota bacterium]|nr:butyrate kinase [Bacteroidota bacterium]
MDYRKVLVINPGSTSTKIAVYDETHSLFLKTIRHSVDELKNFNRVTEQFAFRKQIILSELENAEIDLNQICVIVGRGGLVKPLESGIYEVNDRLREDLMRGVQGEHASNLGGLIAYEIASSLPHATAYIADPVVVDELQDVARISGHPKFTRKSVFHALNQKAVARSYADHTHKKYEELNLIVAHLGGGISVGAHNHGKVIDVNQALDGEGPFTPERSGTLPVGALTDLCFSGTFSHDEVRKMITGKGGYVAYMGTNNAYEVEVMAQNGNAFAQLIQNALAYQVAKEIGSMSAVLKGEVDAIILTGGIAHNNSIVEYIKQMISFIAPVIVYPGEDEMKALAMNGFMVLSGKLHCKEYK